MSATAHVSDIPAEAFAKHDPTPDTAFYDVPRMVAHIDGRAIRAVTALYAEHLTPGMRVLDLMSSRYSHLPDIALDVTGHGMNDAEMSANPQLSRHTVRDLNAEPALPFENGTFDAAVCCVSVQYLERPVAVFGEVRRCLAAGASFVVTFSDRCFPTKAIALWHALEGEDRCAYIAMAMRDAGFASTDAHTLLRRDAGGDPLWAVIGRA